MDQEHKSEMVRVLDKHINARAFDAREVLLFGHCNATEEMADYLLAHEISPGAILDNSISKQGLLYREIPIISPERIQNYTSENSIVLIATRFYAEMSAQLRQLGYGGEIVQVAEYNSFAEYSLSAETLGRKTARVLRGVQTLEQIRARYPAEHLVICPNNALGDVYWAMAFLPEYREKHRIHDTVITIIGDGCRQVAELFAAEKIVTLVHTEMDELVQALIFTREPNCIIVHHDRPYTDNIIRYLDKHLLSFIDYYRCAVYGLAKSVRPVPPTNIAPFVNCGQMPKGTAVILSPYAKSVVELPDGYWEKIADKYSRQGYMVYTNITGSEQPIRGTEALSAPITQMIAVAEHAGTFIGTRSGLCDVLNTAKCRKTVVFPDCFYSTTPHKIEDFFALPGWENIICRSE